MRILCFTHNISWRGGGSFFTAFHRGRVLVERGHQVTIVSISPTRRFGFETKTVNGVQIVEAPDLLPGLARSGWDLWDSISRILHFRREEYDLVHGIESRPAVALPALFLKYTRGTPTILDWADWYGDGGTAHERSMPLRLFTEPIETFCENFFHPLADGCVAMGEPLLERALASGIPRNRVINLLHGCDPDGLVPMDMHQVRAQFSVLPQDGYVLGYLGALRASSAHLLFEAFESLKKKTSKACKLVFIGNHKLHLADHMPENCRPNVVETGWISYKELNTYLAACDLLLLPFAHTTATDNIWPSKLNDHLAVGKPTVATDVRILQPVFNKYQIGLLTRGNPEDFANGCLYLLENPDLRNLMSREARALAKGELSWNRLVERLEEFYCSLIQITTRYF